MNNILESKTTRRNKGEGRAQDERKLKRNEGKAYMNKSNTLVPDKEEPKAEVPACFLFCL